MKVIKLTIINGSGKYWYEDGKFSWERYQIDRKLFLSEIVAQNEIDKEFLDAVKDIERS